MSKFYCRLYQGIMRIGMYFLPWRKPKMVSGVNSIEKVPMLLKAKQINSVIIVTDKGITDRNLHSTLIEALKRNKIQFTIYDKTVPNPAIINIEEGLKQYQSNDCNGIIAIGGGSPMDCAKGIGARVARPKKTITQMRGLLRVKKRIPYLIAIPTTAGTGSETTLAAVITDSSTHEKYALNDPHLIPNVAILDASLTLTLPPMLTASTGMDALTHAIEAYIGNSNTKETKQCAIEATQLIFNNLKKAVKNGFDVEARQNMQDAAFKAGVAFTRAYVGNVHSLAHALGGEYGTPHGIANAVILPIVLEYYGETIYEKINSLCEKAQLFPNETDPAKRTKLFIEAIRTMNKQFGMPEKIDKLDEKDIPILAIRAEKESNPLYPVPMIFETQDFEAIYKKLL